jgi:integrase/recombinase XerD
LAYYADEYLRWMLVTHHSAETVAVRRRYLDYFLDWCDERGLEVPGEVTRAVTERYQRWLFNYRKKEGGALAISSQFSRLNAIRQFFGHLAKTHVMEYNPAAQLTMPRRGSQIPRDTLSPEEMEIVLSQPDTSTFEGLRDRAILELFYSTGIRRMELSHLTIYDIDFSREILFVREGKGRKDRVVPVGNRALRWVRKYLDRARSEMIRHHDITALFLSLHGDPIDLDYLTQLAGTYIQKANLGKKGSCHLFRHTVATLMHENGADIRHIQEMLGHSSLQTTQIYTKVSIKQLKAVHTLTHPTSKPRAEDPPDPPP